MDFVVQLALFPSLLQAFTMSKLVWIFCPLQDVLSRGRGEGQDDSIFKFINYINFRLLHGLFEFPHSSFSPKFELCAGAQFFSNRTSKEREFRRFEELYLKEVKDKIIRVRTMNGDEYFMDIKHVAGKM